MTQEELCGRIKPENGVAGLLRVFFFFWWMMIIEVHFGRLVKSEPVDLFPVPRWVLLFARGDQELKIDR